MTRICLALVLAALCVLLSGCQDLALNQPGSQQPTNGPGSSDPQGGGGAQPSGSGVYIDDSTVIGTWRYADTILDPDAVLTEIESTQAEWSIEIQKSAHEYQADQPAEEYWIFRPDGTGVHYYELRDGTIYQPWTTWWRKDGSGDIVILTFAPASMEIAWDDSMREAMQEFQAGDYSRITDANALRLMHREGVTLCFGDDYIWDMYHRVSTKTDIIDQQGPLDSDGVG